MGASNSWGVERAEAEAIYDQGREAVVEGLLSMSAAIGALTARVEELERQIKRSSRTSSKPPSSDPPWNKRRMRKPSGRARGGQVGHPGSSRARFAPGQVDAVVECVPACDCGGHVEVVGPAQVHQQAELPPVAVQVTEFRLYRGRCRQCGRSRRGQLPGGVTASAFGPRLSALAATLSVRYRLGRRPVCEFFRDVLGCSISTGAVDAIIERAGVYLQQPYGELLSSVRRAPAVNIDETSWRQGTQRCWLWGAATSEVAVFAVDRRRNRQASDALLGARYSGVVCSDGHGAYNHYARRQLCWAHLERNFAALAERGGAARSVGTSLQRIAAQVFAAHQRHGNDLPALSAAIERPKARLAAQIAAGRNHPHRSIRRMLRRLDRDWDTLWTFTTQPAVQPTNNHAERVIRTPVMLRKTSYGTQTQRGSHTTERLLSAAQTTRLQGRSLFGYLAKLHHAAAQAQPPPSLLPA